MKKWFKRFVIGAVVLLIAAFIGVAVFILNIDPSAYKNRLAAMVKAQYDRELVVDGDIELSLFPRIGLTVNNISLSEPGSKEIFAKVDTVRMAVALWPLMSNRFLVDHLAIDGFVAHIIRGAGGRYNFEDLIRHSLPQNTTAKDAHENTSTQIAAETLQQRLEKTDFKVDIAGLTLNKGLLGYHDIEKLSFAYLKDMTVRTGRITEGQPFDLSLSGRLGDANEKLDAQLNVNGLMLLKPLENTYSFNRLNAALTGKWNQLALEEANITGELSINTVLNALTASQLEVSIKGAGDEQSSIRDLQASLTAPNVSYSVGDLRLSMDNLSFESTLNRKDKQTLKVTFEAPALDISPNQAGGEPVKGELSLKTATQQVEVGFLLDKISGTASALKVADVGLLGHYQIANDKALKLTLNSPSEIRIFQKSIEFPKLVGELTLNEKEQYEQNIPLNGYALSLIDEQSTDFFLTAKLPLGDIDIKGQVQDIFHPKVNFDVKGDRLDLKAFLNDLKVPLSGLRKASSVESKAAQPAPQAMSDTNKAETAAVKTEKTQTAGEGQSAKPKEPQQTLTLKQELLSRLSGTGTFNFNQVFYDGLMLDNLGATLLFNHSDVQVRSVRAKAYGGELYANGAYALNQHELKGDISLNNIQLDGLLTSLGRADLLRGSADAKIIFSSQGETEQALVKALQAQVQLSAKQGQIKGLDLDSILRNPEDYANPWDMSARLDTGAEAYTEFTQLKAEANLANEQLSFDQLDFATPTLSITAKSKQADYHFGTKYLYLPATLKAKKGLKVKRAGVTIQVKSVELPILIQGNNAMFDAKLQLEPLLESK